MAIYTFIPNTVLTAEQLNGSFSDVSGSISSTSNLITTHIANTSNPHNTTSAQTNFTPTGTGAVTRSMQSKAREILSVADFSTVAQAVQSSITNNSPLMLLPGEGAVINVPSQVATIQAALDITRSWWISGGAAVVIQLADGTYTTGGILSQPLGGSNLFGTITIQGNATTPANVIVSTTSANCFQAMNGAVMTVADLEMRTSTVGSCLYAFTGGIINVRNVRFGACATTHIEAIQGAQINVSGNYTITGGGVSHMHAAQGGRVLNSSNTVTLTGTPTFSAYFIGVAGPGYAQCIGQTYVGACGGPRFLVHNNGFIDIGNISTALSNPSLSTYFPGSSAGYCNPYTGGCYDYISNPFALLDRPIAFAGNVGVNGIEATFPFQVKWATDGVFRIFDAGPGILSMQAVNLAGNAFKAIQIGGLSLGIPQVVGDPASPSNGDIWYNTSTNKFRARENGVSVNLI